MTRMAATYAYPFDTTPFLEVAAHDLFAAHGYRAFDYADIATARMRALGDAEGHALWLGIGAALRTLFDHGWAPAPRRLN